jgi:hypothetical protein
MRLQFGLGLRAVEVSRGGSQRRRLALTRQRLWYRDIGNDIVILP